MPSMGQLDRQWGKAEKGEIHSVRPHQEEEERRCMGNLFLGDKHPTPRGYQASFSHCLLPVWES